MRPIGVVVLTGLALVLCACATAPAPTAQLDPAERWWSHVAELADDRYEGRFTGSPGYARAASYVAGRFRANGLQPAGTRGYLQPVPFVEQSVFPERSSLSVSAGGASVPIDFAVDAILGNRVPQTASIDAPLVFIGYGLHLPDAGYDDFAAAGDLRGKIVVYLNGGPSTLSAALKSHARAAEFNKALERSGAAGAIALSNPKSMDVPWSRSVLLARKPGMYLDDPSLQDVKRPMLTASFNPAQSEMLFAASGRTFAEMLALADEAKPLPRFDLRARMSGSVASSTRKLTAPNVVGLLPGSDPALQDEYIVLTAHLDGLGIGEPIAGDRIYNGAMDNAAGISSLIEAARELNAAPVKLRRPVLFVAVTAEERGLLGSRWFAEHPTVDRRKLAANINMDMYLPLWPLKAVTMLGIEESTLAAPARAAAAERGLAVIPDPEPDRNRFIRSDQYSFIRTGVPALALKFAAPKGSEEFALEKAWLAARYHAPADDLGQPVDKAGAARFNLFLMDLIRRVADAPERPRWNDDSFFRRFARDSATAP
jgi:Zn-dependent M28 family amino/carboxypeptidase